MALWHTVLVALLLAWITKNYFNKGLQKYPGPLLASLTDWWKLWVMLGRKHHDRLLEAHRMYGDIVRVGPNVLSFGNPEALSKIYGLNKGFVKVKGPGL